MEKVLLFLGGASVLLAINFSTEVTNRPSLYTEEARKIRHQKVMAKLGESKERMRLETKDGAAKGGGAQHASTPHH